MNGEVIREVDAIDDKDVTMETEEEGETVARVKTA
jgi:hypothetical protein